MFRTAVLRAARLPRAAISSASIAANLRNVAVRSTGLAQTTSVRSRLLPALSQKTLLDRGYSTAGTATSEAPAQSEADTGDSGLITRFEDLSKIGVHGNLIKALVKDMKYETMTPVQSMTITPALSGKDLVAQAKTGTGKTLAFLVPVVQRIIQDQPDLASPSRTRAAPSDIRAIILSPTRELAEQIGEEARKLLRSTGIIVQTAVGGTHKNSMLYKTRREGCHLLVATPGRLNDILSSDTGIAAPRLSALVLDEADRMLDVGFDRELGEILRHLPNRNEVPRQTLLFSATIPQNVVSLARTYVDRKNFEFVQTIRPEDTLTHEKVPQHVVSVNGYENLFPTLLELVQREVAASREGEEQRPFKAIVFLPTTNFVQLAQMVFRRIRDEGGPLPRLFHIHSKLTQSARTTAADTFKNSRSAILFSSDVTARGMDFPNVTHVIQVGVPPNREQYIHRLGRTGRADKGGQGWLLIAENELHSARRILTDLPIKRATGLISADHDMTAADGGDEPQTIRSVKEAAQKMPRGLLNDTYMSLFGGAAVGRDIQTTCDNANSLAIHGWGMDKPPAISRVMAAKRGLLRVRGMNIMSASESEDRDSRSDNNFQDRFSNDGDDFERQFSSKRIESRPYGQRNGRDSGGFSRGGGGGGFNRDRGFGRSGGSRGSRGSRNDDRSGGFSGGRGRRGNGQGSSW